jgi:hypothetical protein
MFTKHIVDTQKRYVRGIKQFMITHRSSAPARTVLPLNAHRAIKCPGASSLSFPPDISNLAITWVIRISADLVSDSNQQFGPDSVSRLTGGNASLPGLNVGTGRRPSRSFKHLLHKLIRDFLG